MKKYSINKWPLKERPREKLLSLGADKLSECELLAILLQTGSKSKDDSLSALDLAKEILIEFMKTMPYGRGGSSLNLRAKIWAESPGLLLHQEQALRTRLKREQAGVAV